MIEEDVTLGRDCVLHPHVVIAGRTKVGVGNEFFPFASIGRKAQDLKPQPEETSLEIGDHNSFREGCTVNPGTAPGLVTRISSHNLLLAYRHIAHDCQVGDTRFSPTTPPSPATASWRIT